MKPADHQAAAERFGEAVGIMARLRGPGGCPWDREQSFDSIRKYTLEEVYEVFDAIERRDWPHLKEELGDLLLQVLFYAQMASEMESATETTEAFNIADVVEGLNRKLVRRHPHVFGDAAAAAAGNASAELQTEGIDSAQVLRNWEAIKAAEKAAEKSASPQNNSRLASIPRSMPALVEAQKLGSRAAKSGFDWPDAEGLFAKLEEETTELHEAIAAEQHAGIENEVGDLLFTVVNLARHLKVDPEMALRSTNAKFRNRFAAMETAAERPLEELAPPELEELWSQAKELELSE
jgi:nucleoside triphosphate diphosphatase